MFALFPAFADTLSSFAGGVSTEIVVFELSLLDGTL